MKKVEDAINNFFYNVLHLATVEAVRAICYMALFPVMYFNI